MVKISIIVPVYNVEDFLRKCLDSIVNQTFEDIEVICVNDGSTDSSIDILKEYSKKDDRIKIISKKNQGLGAARNTGMEYVNGEYVLFIDSDDWIELDSLEKLYNNATSNNSDIVLFNSIERTANHREDKKRIYMSIYENIDYNNFIFDYTYNKNLVFSSFFVVWSKFYKTSFLKDNNINFVRYRMFEDVPHHIKSMLLAKRISYLPEILYNYNRLNTNSLQNRNVDFNKRIVLFDIFRNVKEFILENNFYEEFKLEYIRFIIIESKISLNSTKKEFKQEFYEKMRRLFIKMRINSEILKQLSSDIYQFYILVINFELYEIYNQFTYRITEHYENYIDKREISKEFENFQEFGLQDNSIIVSLTSFPERMRDIHYCIYSLLNQTLKPNKLILWLAEEQFPNKEADIPYTVLNLKKNGLTIKWCKDIKSYKKLIPVLKEYPNKYIVTADDDIYYPKNWLEKIWKYHEKYPNDIIATRSRKILFDENNNIEDYSKWPLIGEEQSPSYLNFPTNGAGTLFLPNSLSKEIFNEELFLKLSPSADDMYIWAMLVLNESKIVSIDEPMNELCSVNIVRDFNFLNKTTLWSLNKEGQNDIQLKCILNEFPEILDIIKN